MTELGDNYHGKERVRVAKVRRRPDGVQELVELRVRIELRGGTAASFTAGDNAGVVATDTCKNHVYMLAKTHPCSPPEQFAMDLARTFLQHYDHVNMASIRVEVEPWKRVSGRAGACIVILRKLSSGCGEGRVLCYREYYLMHPWILFSTPYFMPNSGLSHDIARVSCPRNSAHTWVFEGPDFSPSGGSDALPLANWWRAFLSSCFED
jgi:Uricase